MPILHVRPRRQEKGRIYRGCNRFLLRDDCLCVERKDWDGPGGLGSSRRVCCCRAQKKYEIKVIKIISKIGSFLKKIHYTDIEVLLSPPMESNESRNSPIGSWLVLVMIDFSGSLLKYFFFQQRFTFTPYICKQTSTFVLRALIAFERKKNGVSSNMEEPEAGSIVLTMITTVQCSKIFPLHGTVLQYLR